MPLMQGIFVWSKWIQWKENSDNSKFNHISNNEGIYQGVCLKDNWN